MLALLHFENAPGRYPIARREPRALFEHLGSVMLLATDRPVEGLPAAPALEPQLRRAARYFLRTVLLRPGADAYTLLGLRPGFEPAQLREHYRHMIRLTHPDHRGAGETWPADAAARINLARQQLSAGPTASGALAHAVAPALRPMALGRTLPHPRTLRVLPSHRPSAEPSLGWTARLRLALAGMGAALAAGAILLRGPRGPGGAPPQSPGSTAAPPPTADRAQGEAP